MNRHIIIFLALSLFALHSEELSDGWKEPSPEEMEKISSYPVFIPEYPSKEIPYQVNNSYQIYFRPIFSQIANECGHASGVGYTFTYEMNYMRNTNANLSQNQFPTYYTYNFLNKGNELNGSSYLSAWEVIREAGCPYIQDYGGMTPTEDPDLRDRLWLSGNDMYEKALENRVYEIITFPLDTDEGLMNLKHWLFDRGDGSTAGGIANFSAGVNYTWQTGFLPEGTEHEGELVITKWHTTVNHGMTIAGYNDSIRFDLNGDGKFTNDTDITGDGIVDMKDREIGALLMVNTWGMDWGNYGRAWVLYSTLGYEHWEGGIWTQTAHTIQTFDTYQPLMTLRTEIDYPKRDNLKIFAGISSDTTSFRPDKTLDLSFLNKRGGGFPMSGDSSYIDITLDISPLIKNVDNFSSAKIFLCVGENDTTSLSEGKIISMSLKDEWGNIMNSDMTDLSIADNDTTYISANIPIYYDTPQITTNSLPEIVPGEEYYTQLNWRGGREPFRWDFIYNYDIEENNDPLPVEEFVQLEFPHGNYDNDIIPFNLDFSFPFYGAVHDSIFISTDGYIAFQNKFTYISDENSVIETKMAAPCAAELEYYPDLGDGIFYYSTPEAVTISWIASLKTRPEAGLIFAAKLFSDGRIEFYHSEDNTDEESIYIGISNGDTVNYIISERPDIFIPSDFPYGISIGNNGVISGVINEYGRSWNITARITDWNGISFQKDFVLSSTTGIIDNNIPERTSISIIPNPFNPLTKISIDLSEDITGSLCIYNHTGQLVDQIFREKKLTRGRHTFQWEPSSVSSGIYYCVFFGDGVFRNINRMIYLK